MPDRERLVLDITGKTRKDFTEEVRECWSRESGKCSL